MSYTTGDVAELPIQILVPPTDEGTLTDPTTLQLSVTTPAGISSTYSYPASQIRRDGTGLYVGLVTLTEHGEWLYEWLGSGAAADVQGGSFMVEPSISETVPRQTLIPRVGTLLRSHTVSTFENGGRRLGTFTDSTTPTRGQVLELLDEAAQDLAAELGTLATLPDETKPLADSVLVVAGAMLVVLNYPASSSDQTYDRLERRYDKRLASLKQAIKEAGAGDKIGAVDDAVLPFYGFPAAPVTTPTRNEIIDRWLSAGGW